MYILIAVASGILLLAIIITFISYRLTFYTNRKRHFTVFHNLDGELSDGKRRSRELIEKLISLPYENVYIQSRDGLRLHARYYHSNDGAPLQIQLHGYKSVSVRDFSGGALECLKRGHNLLLVDQRAHGESEGAVISFGINERFDVKDWIEYSINRFGDKTKIVLCGISMGAATVLMASELDLPENVIGILADCPYSSPGEIIKKVVRDMKLPAWILYPFIKLSAKIICGFDLEAASAPDAVKRTKIPILLIHGEADSFVPVEMSDKIAAAGKTVTYKRIADAGHGLSFIVNYETYIASLDAFLNKICKDD